VLSDIPTLRELWHDAALFAPPRDSAAWATQLRSLIADPGRRARAAAQRRARRYSLDRFGRAYAGLYRRLAGAGRTAPLTHSGV
jgi:glycosyltransferase involved in cell wall biosynthesis